MSRVYVGRLPARCSERDIERFFKGYGRLRDIVLKTGYGFVEFEEYKDAEDAVYDLHGRDMRGERIIVEHARLPPGSRGSSSRREGRGRDASGRRYGPPTRTEYRVIVENLSSRVSWQDLKDMMRKAGEVTYADAHKSAKNEGIVEFASYTDMKAAIAKFDDYNLYDRRLKVYEDKPRRRSRSDSRRRSRSDSRKGSRKSRSRSSRRRDRSRSDSHRKRSVSARSHSNRDRSRDSDVSHRSKSVSRHSDKSPSRHSEVRSRSPSRNGNGSAVNVTGGRSRSRSASRHHSPSRSRSHSAAHSRSKSRSRTRSHSRSDSVDHKADEEPMHEGPSGSDHGDEDN